MPRTAFIIAADEDMIRHSVAKHFKDPQASHVRDYLDKVIQVPLHVPQVGADDLRAYMYSLFVGLEAPNKLQEVQAKLMSALQNSWKERPSTKQKSQGLRAAHPSCLTTWQSQIASPQFWSGAQYPGQSPYRETARQCGVFAPHARRKSQNECGLGDTRQARSI